MKDRREIRASDSDRTAAVERLRAALDEGRLSLLEYDERLARAYQAVTYGDLADLFVDLPAPASGKAAWRNSETSRLPAQQRPGLPTALRILWTIWLAVVSINLVIWGLVSLSNANPHYFWPMWVAGPSGAALLGVTVGVTAIRRGRQQEQLRRLPRGQRKPR